MSSQIGESSDVVGDVIDFWRLPSSVSREPRRTGVRASLVLLLSGEQRLRLPFVPLRNHVHSNQSDTMWCIDRIPSS